MLKNIMVILLINFLTLAFLYLGGVFTTLDWGWVVSVEPQFRGFTLSIHTIMVGFFFLVLSKDRRNIK